jgi:hypothetical protein
VKDGKSPEDCAYRKPRLAHYGSHRAHVTCYTASLHLVDLKCASSFGEAHPEIRPIYNPSQLAYIHKCVLLGRPQGSDQPQETRCLV